MKLHRNYKFHLFPQRYKNYQIITSLVGDNFLIFFVLLCAGNELENQFGSSQAEHYFPRLNSHNIYQSRNQQAKNHSFLSESSLIRKDFIIYIWGWTHPPPPSLPWEWHRIQEMRLSPTSGVTNGLGWYRPQNFARNPGRHGAVLLPEWRRHRPGAPRSHHRRINQVSRGHDSTSPLPVPARITLTTVDSFIWLSKPAHISLNGAHQMFFSKFLNFFAKGWRASSRTKINVYLELATAVYEIFILRVDLNPVGNKSPKL